MSQNITAFSFRLVSRTEFSSTGATRISGSHSRLIQVVRPQLEGKQRTPLSSRVATCISWRLLSGLKGDRPPVEFGEWTRDCSLGHVGKEGPHLTMTGASHVFSRAEVPVWGFHEVGRGAQGASRVAPKMNFSGNCINWKNCHSVFTLRKQLFGVFPIMPVLLMEVFFLLSIST